MTDEEAQQGQPDNSAQHLPQGQEPPQSSHPTEVESDPNRVQQLYFASLPQYQGQQQNNPITGKKPAKTWNERTPEERKKILLGFSIICVAALVLCGLCSAIAMATGGNGSNQSNTPTATDTPIPPTATPDPQKLATDFTTWYGKILGAQGSCDTLSKGVLDEISNNSVDELSAYDDAQKAHDTCEQSALDLSGISAPSDLSTYQLNDARDNQELADHAEADIMSDMQKLLENPNDLSTASDVQNKTQERQGEVDQAAIPIAQASVALKVDLNSVTPIPPSS